MKALVIRVVCYVAGLVSVLIFVPAAQGEVPIFYAGFTTLAPTGQGSYVNWSRQPPPYNYERLSDPQVGEVWTSDGYNHQVQYYDIYRAFLVFDVPRYKGVVTRDEIGIPDWAVPDVTLLRTKVFGADLHFNVAEDQLGDDLLPIEVRWSSLPSSSLVNGTINPETAFNGLLTGPRVESDLDGFQLGDSPANIPLDDAFTKFLNQTGGGPVVFSFTMPFVDHRGTFDLKSLLPDISLDIHYDGYAPLAPAPESSTYACTGAALCASLALRRIVKARRFRSKCLYY
ncbi:MAG TPA: hypothetical protein VGM64_09895 [Lacunisphaera sp.]|jgi:hypothetical protein